MGKEQTPSGDSQSMSDAVHAFVKAEILSGALPPGRRLTEAWLTNATGASRTPVREALRRLAAEGFVEFAAHRGARVASLGLEERSEIFALRQLLEPFAARAAAKAASPTDVERLRALALAMTDLAIERPSDWSVQLADLNRDFHAGILDSSGFARLRTMTESVVVPGLVKVTFATYTTDELNRSMTHHDELVAAIEAGDEEWAEAAMRTHLRAAENVARRIVQDRTGTSAQGEGE